MSSRASSLLQWYAHVTKSLNKFEEPCKKNRHQKFVCSPTDNSEKSGINIAEQGLGPKPPQQVEWADCKYAHNCETSNSNHIKVQLRIWNWKSCWIRCPKALLKTFKYNFSRKIHFRVDVILYIASTTRQHINNKCSCIYMCMYTCNRRQQQ